MMEYLGDAPFAFLPTLGLEESVTLCNLLSPPDYRKRCSLCLTRLPSDRQDPKRHHCILTSNLCENLRSQNTLSQTSPVCA